MHQHTISGRVPVSSSTNRQVTASLQDSNLHSCPLQLGNPCGNHMTWPSPNHYSISYCTLRQSSGCHHGSQHSQCYVSARMAHMNNYKSSHISTPHVVRVNHITTPLTCLHGSHSQNPLPLPQGTAAMNRTSTKGTEVQETTARGRHLLPNPAGHQDLGSEPTGFHHSPLHCMKQTVRLDLWHFSRRTRKALIRI